MSITEFQASDYINDETDTGDLLQAALDEAIQFDDMGIFYCAMGEVIKARGVAHIATEAGVGRESLYKSITSASKPRFETVVRLVNALGLHLTVDAKNPSLAQRTTEA